MFPYWLILSSFLACCFYHKCKRAQDEGSPNSFEKINTFQLKKCLSIDLNISLSNAVSKTFIAGLLQPHPHEGSCVYLAK